ncbi:MAG: Hemolysin-type calcium-binding region [Deltaproteobacteria bacterium]|nr:Hemolysin-type calcium-binding region [Deltaproteobacteria bacterium]
MRSVVLAGSTCALLVSACGPSSKTGECKDSLIAGDLVITEVFADYKAAAGGTGSDEGKEWFEIYNASDRPVDLEGLTITHSRPDGSKAKTHVMDPVTIAPGQYFTLGNSTPDLVPAYIDYGYSADLGDFFNTDGGKLALACAASEIDSATYELVKEGHARQLTASQPPDYTLNDDLAQWCEGADSEFETGNFGTPGTDNDCIPVVIGQCNDAGVPRATVAPLPGQLVITEAMPSPSKVSDTLGEWFEVKVLADVDLNGLGLDRAGDNAVAPDLLASPDCIHVTAGSYVVFAKSADPLMNGGLPAGSVVGTFKFSSVAGSVTAPGDIQILAGTTVIDAVSWTKSTTGSSLQLDPDFEDAVANDQLSNYCDGVTAYGAGDLGTPGAVNGQCTLLPPAGMCDDAGVIRAIVKPAAGQLVINEFLANPAGSGTDATQEWFEIVNTGATAFDLNDLGLKGNATTINVIQSAACKSIAPAGFALFAHNTDPLQNGMLPAIDATFTFALAASAGSLSVLDGATVLDAITWTTPAVGDGVSRQLNPLNTNSTDNDLPANFCDGKAAQMYGTAANFGTPKEVNVCL